MAKKLNLPLRGVIENMSWLSGADGEHVPIFGSGGGEELAAELGVPLLGQVPLTMALREQSDGGLPVVLADPADAASRAITQIAERLVEMAPAAPVSLPMAPEPTPALTVLPPKPVGMSLPMA